MSPVPQQVYTENPPMQPQSMLVAAPTVFENPPDYRGARYFQEVYIIKLPVKAETQQLYSQVQQLRALIQQLQAQISSQSNAMPQSFPPLQAASMSNPCCNGGYSNSLKYNLLYTGYTRSKS